MLRFREAVAAGAIPFTVQGPENALCLDGGRTLGLGDRRDACRRCERDWRAMSRWVAEHWPPAWAPASAPAVRLDTVQAEGCAPLADGVEPARRPTASRARVARM